jgi:uncharacterized protein
MENSDLKNRIKRAVNYYDKEAEVYLFGSRARGDFNNDSDWDVLVISPLSIISFDYEMNLREKILEIELDTNEVISLLVYSKNDWLQKRSFSTLFSSVTEEGIKI